MSLTSKSRWPWSFRICSAKPFTWSGSRWSHHVNAQHLPIPVPDPLEVGGRLLLAGVLIEPLVLRGATRTAREAVHRHARPGDYPALALLAHATRQVDLVLRRSRRLALQVMPLVLSLVTVIGACSSRRPGGSRFRRRRVEVPSCVIKHLYRILGLPIRTPSDHCQPRAVEEPSSACPWRVSRSRRSTCARRRLQR